MKDESRDPEIVDDSVSELDNEDLAQFILELSSDDCVSQSGNFAIKINDELGEASEVIQSYVFHLKLLAKELARRVADREIIPNSSRSDDWKN